MEQEMDEGVGEIIATLRRLQLDGNTFVFFCSDNGGTREGNNGPLNGTKGSTWEGGHRVPGIAWWPGKIAPGTTDQTALSMDLMPTMLDLARVATPRRHKLDGTSLAPLLLKGKSLPERTLFWSYTDRFAVRQGPWKLLVNQPRPDAPKAGKKAKTERSVSLYRLGDDLGEKKDLAAQQRERVGQMQAALAAWRKDVGSHED
jgi:arylsulfatase A-like enzyme